MILGPMTPSSKRLELGVHVRCAYRQGFDRRDLTLEHEVVGIVYKLGRDVRGVREGERVAVNATERRDHVADQISKSILAGSSMQALTCLRKVTASRPSTMR